MNFAQFGMFYEGLLSMSPKGVWLPFSEVVHMAHVHSWSLEGCKAAAHIWSHLGAVELDPPSDNMDSQIIPQRIRLLYQPDMDARGLVEISSEEEQEPCSSVSGSSSVSFRRWKSGALQPEYGVTVEIPFSEPLDRHDAVMLQTYYSLYATHLLDKGSRGHSCAPDIPRWALDLFSRPGFEWSPARVRACADSMLLSLTPDSVETDVEPDVEPAVEPSRKPQDTKWGRCTSPTCSGRAFRPIMGCKGPFLICSREQCKNSRSLTLEEWQRLPKKWQEFWPCSWHGVQHKNRPKRPVQFLGKACKRRR